MMTGLEIKEAAAHTDWESVKSLFNLTPDYIHLGAAQFIASHPKPVREAIERYRRALDADPVYFVLDHENQYSQSVRIAAARYLEMEHPDHIALTDSTTMGLGLVYTGLMMKPGQEILTTEHDHYSHQEAIRLACERAGSQHRQISLFKDLKTATEDEMVDALIREVRPTTRAVGLTWVHSSTGLKLPIKKFADALARLNNEREHIDKVLLVIDGVHGFGIETESFAEMGCDFFIAGCHKWLYGPRGTGIIAGTAEAWKHVIPVIPTFTYVMDAVTFGMPRPKEFDGRQMTPGGFHSLEHRWALKDAFDFIHSLGKQRIKDRVYELTRQVKEGLAELPHVKIHTPMDATLSAGIVAFEVDGYTTEQVVSRLKRKNIISTSSPYLKSYARFTPGLYISPDDVKRGLEAVASLGKG
ncbi:aminotransferase class V-fold PLP-dependent enzyme [Paenibacillus xerothermodurans]|uniref:Aminotransferase class V-fold PLP-dependent enzyme n=1 Tax=Paenibacillus xerothermodurans TaxID=1977292 RepID=A0A2W1NDN0_PAEXE|nr:aminotransferase class V-fold PLP-dependent enzyme [Paenibacillus xerothermodurans]PZE21720.1 aminotransferase class V-fold PLP-dependent enzyme [Paenibacillus xerothermodurans]